MCRVVSIGWTLEMNDAQALRAEASRLIRLTRLAWDDDVRQKLNELGHDLESEALKLERIETFKKKK
jgi:hypothetical protein